MVVWGGGDAANYVWMGGKLMVITQCWGIPIHNNFQGGGDVTYSPDPVLLGSASRFDGHCAYRILVDS